MCDFCEQEERRKESRNQSGIVDSNDEFGRNSIYGRKEGKM